MCALAALGFSQVRADVAPSCPAADALTLSQPTPTANQPSYLDVETASESDWRFDLQTYTWLVGMTGDIGARGQTAHADVNFLDIADASDSLFAFSGRLEVGKGRWGGFVEGIYSRLGAEDLSGPAGHADVDMTFTMAVVDFGLMYRVAEWAPGGNAEGSRQHASVDIYGGGRYTSLDLELSPANVASRSSSKSWVDPIVGAKLVFPLTRQWYIQAWGDIGGFGVASDLTWSAAGIIGYDFTLFKHDATVFAGYRGVGEDYSKGSGDDEFKWDVILHGPVIGVNIKF